LLPDRVTGQQECRVAAFRQRVDHFSQIGLGALAAKTQKRRLQRGTGEASFVGHAALRAELRSVIRFRSRGARLEASSINPSDDFLQLARPLH
jgi:hypothetical protein